MNAGNGTPLLLDQIIQIKPRETAGTRSANRLGYQQSWAFCLLLKLHRDGHDYAVLMDFHDDVVVLNSATAPTEMEFYQVKSLSSGNWTLAKLIKAESGEAGPKLSIAAKMYDNIRSFPTTAKSVNFVSNAPFRVKLKRTPTEDEDEVVDSFNVTDLAAAAAQSYGEALKAQHGLAAPPPFEISTVFARQALPILEHAKHSQGEFADFLDARKPGGKFAVAPAFRSIMGIIEARTTCELIPSTSMELLKSRGITRTEFEAMLNEIAATEDAPNRWAEMQGFLTAEGFTMPEIQRLRSAWNKYEAQRTDATNTPLSKLSTVVRQEVQKFMNQNPNFTLRSARSACLGAVRQSGDFTISFNDDALFAMILYHCHEIGQLPPSAP